MTEPFLGWRDRLFAAVVAKVKETDSPGVNLSELVTQLEWEHPEGWVTYAAHSFATAGWAKVNFAHRRPDTGITLFLHVGGHRAWQAYRRDLEERISAAPVGSPAERLKSALDELEDALSAVEPFTSRIGDNNPPEAIGVPPYGNEDHQAVRANIGILREQLTADTPDRHAAEAAGRDISAAGGRIRRYCAEQGDAFIKGVVKSSSDVVGKVLGAGFLFLLGALGDKLIQVALVVWEYLASLSLLS